MWGHPTANNQQMQHLRAVIKANEDLASRTKTYLL
jgi:hypothetical protein